ncbi:fatty acid desaturase [Pseudophaeobacter sp. EL27]|uniref:fatty acid desaturase n=1 Tax=Pseudophaeobacter sp. EL27 TaxID=2107580 RepID=UPI000EFD0592|nr:fatty acid desaturase [Pseudophaeobacter sp. EL27]
MGNASGQCGDDFVPQARRNEITKESRIYLFLYASLLVLCLWAEEPVLLFVWLLPMVIGQPFLRLYLLAEHGRCAFVANIFENTRTTFTNRLVRAIAWNMPFHTEHHSYPSVPFHNLPELHKLMKPHLSNTADGYTSFTEAYARHLSG